MAGYDRGNIKRYVPFVDFTAGANKVIMPSAIDNATEWKLLFARVRFAATATLGNRLVEMTLADDQGQFIYQVGGRANIPPNGNVLHTLLPGTSRSDQGPAPLGFTDFVEVSIPGDLIVHRGHTLRFRDSRGVDPADLLRVSGMIAVVR